MQKYSDSLNHSERRIALRWRLGAVGFYGSILAALISYAIYNQGAEVELASGATGRQFAVASARRLPTPERPATAQPHRACDQRSC